MLSTVAGRHFPRGEKRGGFPAPPRITYPARRPWCFPPPIILRGARPSATGSSASSSLQADNETMGRTVAIDGRVTRPWTGAPQLLKRCLSNLVDNAVL